MSKTIEVRSAISLPDDKVLVHTGYFVRDSMTLRDLATLMSRADPKPDFIEIDLQQFFKEEEE